MKIERVALFFVVFLGFYIYQNFAQVEHFFIPALGRAVAHGTISVFLVSILINALRRRRTAMRAVEFKPITEVPAHLAIARIFAPGQEVKSTGFHFISLIVMMCAISSLTIYNLSDSADARRAWADFLIGNIGAALAGTIAAVLAFSVFRGRIIRPFGKTSEEIVSAAVAAQPDLRGDIIQAAAIAGQFSEDFNQEPRDVQLKVELSNGGMGRSAAQARIVSSLQAWRERLVKPAADRRKAIEALAQAQKAYDKVIEMLDQAPSRSLRQRVDEASGVLDRDWLKSAAAGGSLNDVTSSLQLATQEVHKVIRQIRAEEPMGSNRADRGPRAEESQNHSERVQSPTTVEDALRIFNVPSSASLDQIKKIYQAHTKSFHPDLAGEAGEDHLKKINVAYDILRKHLAKG